jgi:hypothetical protein
LVALLIIVAFQGLSGQKALLMLRCQQLGSGKD